MGKVKNYLPNLIIGRNLVEKGKEKETIEQLDGWARDIVGAAWEIFSTLPGVWSIDVWVSEEKRKASIAVADAFKISLRDIYAFIEKAGLQWSKWDMVIDKDSEGIEALFIRVHCLARTLDWGKCSEGVRE